MKRSRSYAPRPSSYRLSFPQYKKKKTINRATYKTPANNGARKVAPRAGPSNRSWAQFIYNEKLVSLNPGAGTLAQHTFSLSGLFDPNISGGGHQPTNFDQLMLIYEEYLVYQAEYIVKFYNTAAANYRVGVTITDNTQSITDTRQFVENGQTEWDMLMDPASGAARVVTFKGTVDIAKAHGITREDLMGDAQYVGTDAQNPTDTIQLNLWCDEIAAGDVAACYADVEIRYKAYLLGSKLNSIS